MIFNLTLLQFYITYKTKLSIKRLIYSICINKSLFFNEYDQIKKSTEALLETERNFYSLWAKFDLT